MLIRLIVPGEEERIEDLNASLETVLARHGIDAGLRGDVRLIVEELASNALKYGGSGARDELSVKLAIADGLLQLDFHDAGEPFNPLDAPAPDLDADILERDIGGLGLHLIKQLAKELHYERVDDCNLLHLKLRIPTEQSA